MVYRAKRDPESRFFRIAWIPAFSGMTVFRTFARASRVKGFRIFTTKEKGCP